MNYSVAVIGTVFIDYKGFAPPGYNAAGRNVGRVEVVPGGVARNVAVNMRALGLDTWFVGALNDDGPGAAVKEKMADMGIRLDHLVTAPGGSGAWLAIINHRGELLGSVSHMPDLAVMESAILPALSRVLPRVAGVALEVDLNEKIVLSVVEEARRHHTNIYALPGNLSVIGKNYELFQYLECFICNDTEFGQLTKSAVTGPDAVLPDMRAFAGEYRLKKLVVTFGERGAVYLDSTGGAGFQDVYETPVVDATGAGDAFFSAAAAALLRGKSLAEAAAAGAKTASFVIASRNNDCSFL
jgi:pseudouridine kinase